MKLAIPALALLPLAACVETQEAPVAIGMANPASVHCANIGGTSEIKTASDGSQTGYCRLPDGKLVEEWELFRAAQRS